ncbi:C-type lectin domain family 4 member M-like [Branchiostoma floridae x Branchiostoma japonicum]
MAAQACESKRATLAMPKTGELDGALRELVMTVGGNQEYWIGLWEGETDTGWQWVDGTPLQTNDYQVTLTPCINLRMYVFIYMGWNPGEPSNYGFVWGNCVQYWSGSTGYPMWDDTDCFIFKRFICQAPRL